ncbi:MAG: metal-sensitive transcriptional regulator [Acidimicrobiales bacterium]|jgi:DNA-binding FrmR family transcriptional regulator
MTEPTRPGAAPANAGGTTYGYFADKDALIKRMHRIAGQVGGVEKMIADDRYCIDILTQISAVGTALEAVAFTILDDHVNHCVAHALATGDKQVAADKSRELLEAVHRFARTR